MSQTMSKSMITEAVISSIKEKASPKEIRAKHLKDYIEPGKILYAKGQDKGYTPDITAVFDDETHVYEIELNKEISTEKWHLFSLFARKNSGNFYLVVPDYLKEKVKQEIESNKINAGLIYFNTK